MLIEESRDVTNLGIRCLKTDNCPLKLLRGGKMSHICPVMICIREAGDLNIKWWCIKYFSCEVLVAQFMFSCAEFPTYYPFCLAAFSLLSYIRCPNSS